jgi:hypothetical protein
MTSLLKTIHSPGQNTGSLPKVSKLLLRKQKWSRTSLEVSNKMSKKIRSQDSNFEEIWKEMDEIEPLTPPPADVEDSYRAYKEAALSDAYMFGEYDGYEAYAEEG